MIKYRIFIGNVEIRLLEINDEGYHKYTPIEEQIEYAVCFQNYLQSQTGVSRFRFCRTYRMVIYREETWGMLVGIKNEYVTLLPEECRKAVEF